MGAKKNNEVTCEICGKIWMAWSSDNPRFCSQECFARHKHQEYIKRWQNGNETGNKGKSQISLSNYVVRYIHEKHNDKCQLCGFDKKHPRTGNSILQIHHVDENPRNSIEDNLMLLCPNCHALEDSKDTNKGNGRRYERQKYHREKN